MSQSQVLMIGQMVRSDSCLLAILRTFKSGSIEITVS